MGPMEIHMQRLRARHPDATMQELAGAGSVITVPTVQLPPGWNKPVTTVHFWAQPGYPFSKLDCFWADNDLRLASGGMPQASGFGNGPPMLNGMLWFSWHTDHWNASRDDFVTWMGTIRERLNRAV